MRRIYLAAWSVPGFFVLATVLPAQQFTVTHTFSITQAKIGGGGFFDGISQSSDGSVLVVRTDTSGAYVAVNGGAFKQLLNTSTVPSGYWSVGNLGVYEAIVAPNNNAVGAMIFDGYVWISLNLNSASPTWALSGCAQTDTNVVQQNAGGFRLIGPKMAFDPINADVLYIGWPANGLYEITDASSGGATCTQITTVPPAYLTNNAAGTTLLSATVTNVSGNNITVTTLPATVANGMWAVDTTIANALALPGGATISSVVTGAGGTFTVSAQIGAGIQIGDVLAFASNNVAVYKLPGYSIVFDTSNGVTGGKTNNIYISPWGQQVWSSTNAGSTWAISAASGPTKVQRMDASASGDVWVASVSADNTGGNSNIWHLTSGAWTQLGTAGLQLPASAIAVDPTTSGATTHIAEGGGGTQSFSANNGVTWTSTINGRINSPVGGGTHVCGAGEAPWLCYTSESGSTADLKFDRATPNTLYWAEGINFWVANPPCTTSPNQCTFSAYNWNSMSKGVENLVPTSVVSVPGYANPFLGVEDRATFVTTSIAYPAFEYPTNNLGIVPTWQMDYAGGSVCGITVAANNSGSACSSNGGTVWTFFAYDPFLNNVATTQATAAGNAVLHFGNGVPDTVYSGMTAIDTGTYMTAIAPTAANNNVVHFSAAALAAAAIGNGFKMVNLNAPSQTGTSQNPTQLNPTVSGLNSPNPGDITLSANIIGNGVAIGDVYAFTQASSPVSTQTVSSIDRAANTVTLSANVVNNGILSGETMNFTVASATGGSIAMASPASIIQVPSNNAKYPWYTKDGGLTWKRAIISTTGPGFNADGSANNIGNGTGWSSSSFSLSITLAADKTDGTLYAYNCRTAVDQGGLYASSDGGDTWTLQNAGGGEIANHACGQDAAIKTTPGKQGHIWITGGPFATGGAPFEYSTDHGQNWTACAGVSIVRGFGFAAVKPGAPYPTIWIYGTTSAGAGLQFSTDQCASWTFLTQYPGGVITGGVNGLDGDKNLWNVVYFGIGGGGFLRAQYNFLLNRDLGPAANDNSPMFLNQAA